MSSKQELQDQVVVDMYTFWCMYYSKKNLWSYWPPFDDLSNEDKEFWRKFVQITINKVKLASIAVKESLTVNVANPQ